MGTRKYDEKRKEKEPSQEGSSPRDTVLEEVICIHASMVHFSNSLSTLSIEGKIQVLEEEGLDEFLLRLDRYIRKYEEIIKESNPGVLGDNQDIPDSE
ncbi:MAG TPA: hypothetical protein PLG47_04515 [Candidatus Dojkabacteria bacterium]|nr:hypothetical protein [Candidatus Dojkabacteria bacterium]